MTVDKQNEYSSNNEKANLKSTRESNVTSQDSSVSKENLPSISKILIADDGKDESNRVINYVVSLSRNSGAELLILRILEDMEKMGNVSVQGSNEGNMSNKDMKREVKGGIMDEMEKKINRC